MQFEINREDLLKLKQTNYDLYQLIMSQKSLDGDYCETLDKQKLAKECELGYFKIDELFTKEQIANAYKNIEKRVEDNAGKVLKAYSIDATDFVRGYSFAEEIKKAAQEDLISSVFGLSRYSEGSGASDSPIEIPQKKHAMLLDVIDKTYKEIFIKIENAEQHHEIQDYCFGHGIYWFASGKKYLPFDVKGSFKDIKIGFRDIKKLQRCIFFDFAPRGDVLSYDLKTEQFIN